MKFRLYEKADTASGALTHYSAGIDIAGMGGDSYSLQTLVTVDTPAAKTFAASAVNTATDAITITAHGYTLGLKGQVSNPGTLPTGISGSTDYFVIVIDANTIKLASSLANAQAGTQIDITAQGAGTNTFTPTALAGGTVGLQQSDDNVTYFALGATQAISATGSFYFEKDRPCCRYIRAVYVLTAGHLTSSNFVLVKGDLD